MRNSWRLSISLVALVLVSCAMPGGIYKGYEGLDRDLKEIAVIAWSSSILAKPRSAEVTRIDTVPVQKERPPIAGIRNTIAHLLPGRHTIRIKHYWEDLYFKNSNKQFFSLTAYLLPGQSYLILETPCKSCEPFAVKFFIVDAASGATAGEKTMVGSGPYGEARKEKRREEREKKRKCVRKCDEKEDSCKASDKECEEEGIECRFDCTFNPFR